MSLKSAEIFKKMGAALPTYGKDIVSKIQAVYLFELRASKDAQPVFFTVDLKNGSGKLTSKHLSHWILSRDYFPKLS